MSNEREQTWPGDAKNKDWAGQGERKEVCPPDGENNTPEAPAPRAAPLAYEKSDIGCLIALGALFVLVFLLPAALLLGGAPLIVPGIVLFLMVLATPWINPAERMGPKVKWWGRVLTFLLLTGLLVAGYFVLRHYLTQRAVEVMQEG